MDIEKTAKALERRGFKVKRVKDGKEAREWLLKLIDPSDTVGTGGSATLREIGLVEALHARGNVVYNRHLMPEDNPVEVMRKGNLADWFISSANAITEDGEIVNTDGIGNRVAGQIYGGPNTVFVVGGNKIVPDLAAAFGRIRKVAARKNCERFGYADNPCVTGGDCRDCPPETNICHATTIIHMPTRLKTMYVVLADENLGY